MTPAEYQEAVAFFRKACDLPADERELFLRACTTAGPSVAAAVRKMLSQDDRYPDVADVDETMGQVTPEELTTEAARARAASLVPQSDTTAPRPHPVPGSTFGSYELLEEIGRGGMGVVFKARQRRPDRLVAIKTIRAGQFASKADVQRFVNEAEAAAKLEHEGIVPVYDVGCEHGAHYFSMPFVEGTNLAELLAKRPPARSELLSLFLKVCDAVAHCHRAGIVHRDLKPSNILIDGRGQPRITDFGLARHLEQSSALTATGEIMGTPGYMPPEQASGESMRVGETADVYSLGAILYHLLTGRPPILAQDVNLAGAIQLVREHDVLPPKFLNRAVPRDLDIVCSKCLEKNPADRYPNAGELAADIRRFQDDEPIQARGLQWNKRIMRWARQQPGLAATWAVVCMFYLWHLIHFYLLPNQDLSWAFHWRTTATAAIWATGAYIFQRLLVRHGGRSRILFAWATMDVLLLTCFLASPDLHGGKSYFVYLYFPIVAHASLRFRTDLVAYVTGLTIIAYLLHVGRNNLSPTLPDVALSEAVTFSLSVLAVGIVQYLSLRRSRVAIETLARKEI